MGRRTANNPSGKWLAMTDEQTDRADAAFERAVARQRERDAARARETARLVKTGRWVIVR